MAVDRSEFLSSIYKEGIFSKHTHLRSHRIPRKLTRLLLPDNRVVFVTGGAGTICKVQTKALVYLGANACILGRNVEKTEAGAKEIAAVRNGAKVIGIGGVDVRNVCHHRQPYRHPHHDCHLSVYILTHIYSSTASRPQLIVASRSLVLLTLSCLSPTSDHTGIVDLRVLTVLGIKRGRSRQLCCPHIRPVPQRLQVRNRDRYHWDVQHR